MQQSTVLRFQAAKRLTAKRTGAKWVMVLWSAGAFVLGLWLLARPDLTTDAFVLVLGAYLMTGATCELASVALNGGEDSQTCVLFGSLGVVAGLTVLGNSWLAGPLSVTSQSYLLGAVALFWGLIKMLDQGSGERESWSGFVLGLLHFLLGTLLLLNPTVSVLGFLAIMGVAAMITGLVSVVLTFEARPTEVIW